MTTRLVPITEMQFQELSYALDTYGSPELDAAGDPILEAFRHAPANPEAAIRSLLFRMIKEWPDDEDDGDFAYRVTQAVLRALKGD